MTEHTSRQKSDRVHDRLPLVAEIVVTFQSEPIRGSGRNVSAAGVYFIADEEVRTKVRIGDREVDATLVRLENHGRGRTGIAVRFDEGALD